MAAAVDETSSSRVTVALDELLEVFGDDESVQQQLAPLFHAEALGGKLLDPYQGFRIAHDRLFLFFVRTFDLAERGRRERGSVGWYGPLLLDYVTQFKRLRAAYRVALCNYPLFGLALLRDVKDRSLLYAAILRGKTTYRELSGADAIPDWPRVLSEDDWIAVSRRRQANERTALAAVVGKDSGLDRDQVRELERWRDIFHQQVHASLHTYADEGWPWVSEGGQLSALPAPSTQAVAMFMNRSTEVCWLLLRTLPLLQLEPAAFGPDWAHQWRLLDSYFGRMANIDRSVAQAVCQLVATQFVVSPESTAYRE